MLLATLVQIFAQGLYWQLIPLCLLSVLAPIYAWNSSRSLAARISFAIVAVLLLGSTVTSSLLLPLFRLPTTTGPYPVGTRILHFVDPSRPDTGHRLKSGHRELMVQAWYPIDASQAHGSLEAYRRPSEVTLLSSYMTVIRTHSFSNAPIAASTHEYPVILFNPAWKGPRTECEYLMEDLASHGFVVFSIDHTYNSGPVAFPDGTRIVSALGPEIDDFAGRKFEDEQKQGDDEVRLQAQDNSFVLDGLMNRKISGIDRWYKPLNLDQVGVVGHSFGGSVALQTAYSDPRVVSAINMDGWVFGDPAHIILRKPTMQMNEQIAWPTPEQLSKGGREFKIYWQFSAADARFRQDSIAASGGYSLTIEGSRHMDFADRSLYSPIKRWTDSGTITPQRAHQIVCRYANAFFARTLLNEVQPLLEQQNLGDKNVAFAKFSSRAPN
ncbi:MAG: dienelactone hydrolase family protein [Granulicella sp.]